MQLQQQSSLATNHTGNRRRPNYAIVHLPEGTNVVNFYQLLLENGFSEVSFVNEVRENAFLPSLANTNSNISSSNNNHSYAVQQQQQSQIPNQQIANNGGGMGKNTATATALPHLSMANVLEGARALLRQHQQQHQSVVVQQLHSRNNELLHIAPPTPPTTQHPSRAPTQNLKTAVCTAFISDQNNAQTLINAVSPAASTSSSPSLNQMGIGNGATTGSNATTTLPKNNGDGNGSGSNGNEEYAICLLCNNRLMSSRLSNLTNHVRRHAPMKQYRCRHCQYSHNEMAKVRLHMSHNHHDFDSQPVDQLTFEMQLQWGLLMEQCFPDHAKRFGPSAANSQFRCLDQLQKYVDLDRSYTCIECGELIQGYRLVNHLEDRHNGECTPSACGECGYESSSQWKVRLHISVKHPERAAEVEVQQRPAGNWMLFLHKFFSEVHISALEEEEAKLVAQLREKNANFEDMMNNDNDQLHDLLVVHEETIEHVETENNDGSIMAVVREENLMQTEENTNFVKVGEIGQPNVNQSLNPSEKQKYSEQRQNTQKHPGSHVATKQELVDEQTQQSRKDLEEKTPDIPENKHEGKELVLGRNNVETTEQHQQKSTSGERHLRKRESPSHVNDQTATKRQNLRHSNRLIEQQKQKQQQHQQQQLNHNYEKHHTERSSTGKVDNIRPTSGLRKK